MWNGGPREGRSGLDGRAIEPGTVRYKILVPFPRMTTCPLDYLEFDYVTVEPSGNEAKTAEAICIGYAPQGMMKEYVAVPVRLPTRKLTGYIGIVEGKVPKGFHLSRVVTFSKKTA
jgi:hypothetical protein